MSTPQWFAEFERQEAMRQERLDNIRADMERRDATPECERCAGSGEVAVWASTLTYCGPGPVPDYARGVRGMTCDRCGGSGKERTTYIEDEENGV